MKAWPKRIQPSLEVVTAHMSRRIFDKAAGCDRKGEWLLSRVCVIVVPPIVLSTAAIM
jgi:hypothetical protein